MSDADTTARPRQLTTAAGFVIGGSALLVVAVFDRLGSLESVDTRDAVTQTLEDTNGLSMTVDGVLTAMRVGLNVAAVCAAAAVVLGIFVLQRHKGARVGLGVLAVPILLTAPLTGSFLGAVVAAAIAMLWSGPARDWYAGRAVRQAPDRPAADGPGPDAPDRPARDSTPPDRPDDSDRPVLSTGATSTAPQASRGYGEVPAAAGRRQHGATSPLAPGPSGPHDEPPEQGPGQQQGEYQGEYQGQPPVFRDPAWTAGPAYVPSGQRPPTPVGVKLACWLTWVFSVAVVLAAVVSMVVVARDAEAVLADLRTNPAIARAGLTPDGLLAMMWVVVVLMAGWAASAMVLAWFVWRRHDWARYLLVLSAAAVFVAAVFAFPVGVPLQAACAGAMVLLLNRSARSWFGDGTPPPDRPVW